MRDNQHSLFAHKLPCLRSGLFACLQCARKQAPLGPAALPRSLLGVILYKVADPQDSPEMSKEGGGTGMGRRSRCRIGNFILATCTLSEQVFETPRLEEHNAPLDKDLEIELQNVDTSKAQE